METAEARKLFGCTLYVCTSLNQFAEMKSHADTVVISTSKLEKRAY
jgi:hypothetical protein